MMKKALAMILCIALLCTIGVTALTVSAEELTKEKEYKPLDLVIVVDGSGSMISSDPDRTAPAAVRMLVNMMPAETSRVGIISFNTEPTVLTKDASGNDSLISLDSLSGVESVRSANSKIVYSGDTGIGNALYGAVDLLKGSDDSHDKAIILFTDGLNDFGSGPLAKKNLSDCDNNESAAILWAKDNSCPIYCIGYDYKTPSGVSSMGEDGEGITKLTKIADSTNGKFKKITNINEAKQLLIEFLADVCDINYTQIDVIPGDGGHHECIIPVSPSVVEANIRIAGGDSDSIKNGLIVLRDPSGKEIELKNSGNVRVDTDATAESIKVIMPAAGDWILTLDGIIGDDIEIGLLEHFKMNLTSELSFPEGNPVGVAYTNDTVGIRTWLSYEGNKLSEQAIYDAVKSATATCTSRMDPNDVTVVELEKKGTSFEGGFTVHQDSYYDILIRLEWDSVYREDTLEVGSTNKPLYFVNNNNGNYIEDVAVNKGKTVTVDDIFKIVKDDENDPITAEAVPMDDTVADIKVSDDKIEITGKKWSSTVVNVTYTDSQNNTVSTSFQVTVNDPVAIALIIGGFILVTVLILLGIYFAIKKFFMVSGKAIVLHISDGFIDSGEYMCQKKFYENKSIKNDVKSAPAVRQTKIGFGPASPFNQKPDSNQTTPNPFAKFRQSTNTNDNRPDQSGGFAGFDKKSVDNASPTTFSMKAQTESAKVYPSQDTERDRQFSSNEKQRKLSFGRIRGKQKTLYGMLELFLDSYGKIVNVEGDSELYQDICRIISDKFSPFRHLKLIGSYYGRGSTKIVPEKNVLTQLIFHTPALEKKKVTLNPKKGNNIKVSISVLKGTKTQKGFDECSHIEFIFSKR